MNSGNLNKIRYPIGEFVAPETISLNEINHYIDQLAVLPSELIAQTLHLSENQLDTPYRADGWTVRQVVHHLCDSHMNAYCRFKMAYTEELPEIRPYREERWAELEDGKYGPLKISLSLLEALHFRWVAFLKSIKFEDFQKAYYHPEKKRLVKLDEALASYAWHSKHHLAHIRGVRFT